MSKSRLRRMISSLLPESPEILAQRRLAL